MSDSWFNKWMKNTFWRLASLCHLTLILAHWSGQYIDRSRFDQYNASIISGRNNSNHVTKASNYPVYSSALLVSTQYSWLFNSNNRSSITLIIQSIWFSIIRKEWSTFVSWSNSMKALPKTPHILDGIFRFATILAKR